MSRMITDSMPGLLDSSGNFWVFCDTALVGPEFVWGVINPPLPKFIRRIGQQEKTGFYRCAVNGLSVARYPADR